MNLSEFLNNLTGYTEPQSVMAPGPRRKSKAGGMFTQAAEVAEPLGLSPNPLAQGVAAVAGVLPYLAGEKSMKDGLGMLADASALGRATKQKNKLDAIIKTSTLKGGKEVAEEHRRAAKTDGLDSYGRSMLGDKLTKDLSPYGLDGLYTHIPDDKSLVDVDTIKSAVNAAKNLNGPIVAGKMGSLYKDAPIWNELPEGMKNMRVVIDPKMKPGNALYNFAREHFKVYGNDKDGYTVHNNITGNSMGGKLKTRKEAEEKLKKAGYHSGGSIIMGPTTDTNEMLNVIFHEFQHGISAQRGAYQGGNLGSIAKTTKDVASVVQYPKQLERKQREIDEVLSFLDNGLGQDDYVQTKTAWGMSEDDALKQWYGLTEEALAFDSDISKGLKSLKDAYKQSMPTPEAMKAQLDEFKKQGFDDLDFRRLSGISPDESKAYAVKKYRDRTDEQFARGNANAAVHYTDPFKEIDYDTVPIKYMGGWFQAP